LLIVQNRIKKLKDELLLFSRQQFDLLELTLKLRLRSGIAFDDERLAAKKFQNENSPNRSGSFDKIQRQIRHNNQRGVEMKNTNPIIFLSSSKVEIIIL